MEKTEENMFVSLEPYIPMPSDIQYMYLDEESIGTQTRKIFFFFKLVLLTFQSHLLDWQNYL